MCWGLAEPAALTVCFALTLNSYTASLSYFASSTRVSHTAMFVILCVTDIWVEMRCTCNHSLALLALRRSVTNSLSLVSLTTKSSVSVCESNATLNTFWIAMATAIRRNCAVSSNRTRRAALSTESSTSLLENVHTLKTSKGYSLELLQFRLGMIMNWSFDTFREARSILAVPAYQGNGHSLAMIVLQSKPKNNLPIIRKLSSMIILNSFTNWRITGYAVKIGQ